MDVCNGLRCNPSWDYSFNAGTCLWPPCQRLSLRIKREALAKQLWDAITEPLRGKLQTQGCSSWLHHPASDQHQHRLRHMGCCFLGHRNNNAWSLGCAVRRLLKKRGCDSSWTCCLFVTSCFAVCECVSGDSLPSGCLRQLCVVCSPGNSLIGVQFPGSIIIDETPDSCQQHVTSMHVNPC